MKNAHFAICVASFGILAAGCGSSEKTVTATASIYNGPTAATTGASLSASRASLRPGPSYATPSDGTWYLSPNQIKFTVTSIQLGDADAAQVSCEVTYDSSKPGLTKLSDCPFSVKTGSYGGANIRISPTFEILINDPTNGFYTTSSGIVTTPPDASAANNGAQFYSFTSQSTVNAGKAAVFASPLQVTESDAGTLYFVIDGLQFFHVSVSAGTVSVVHGNTGSPDNIPDMIISTNSLAKAAYYSNSGIGKAGSYLVGPSVTGVTSATVFYSDATTPYWIQLGLNGTPTNCPINGGAGAMNNAANGYLGLDSSSTLGWALGPWSSTTNGFTSYATEFRMSQLSTLGSSTPLYCAQISADPAPTGGSFSSGAPSIASAANQIATMQLVAQ